MEPIRKQFVASAVSFSEAQQSEIYQSITLRMFEAPGANLNGCAVTEAFIDEIIANADKYVCIPLCADVDRIKRGDLNNLGHMYDARTGEFKSQMIGGFHSFSKEITEDGCALIGEARVMKRNKQVCEALATLFERGELNFSFEVTAGEYTQDEFGNIIIDASEANYLEGIAVVSHPAYVNAKALQLVAEAEEGKGSNMEQEIVAGVIDVENILNTEKPVEQNEEAAEPAAPAEQPEVKAPQVEEVPQAEEAQEAEEVQEPVAEEAEIPVIEEEAAMKEEPGEDEDTGKKPEEEDAACKKKCEEEDAACKKNAEVGEEIVAQLKADIETLRNEIASLKVELAEKKETVAVAEVTEAVNPFVSEITTNKSYSLLESCEFGGTHYSLLDKAD